MTEGNICTQTLPLRTKWANIKFLWRYNTRLLCGISIMEHLISVYSKHITVKKVKTYSLMKNHYEIFKFTLSRFHTLPLSAKSSHGTWKLRTVISLRHNAVTWILANGSMGVQFLWKLCCHWLKGWRQRQIAVVRQGQRGRGIRRLYYNISPSLEHARLDVENLVGSTAVVPPRGFSNTTAIGELHTLILRLDILSGIETGPDPRQIKPLV